MVIIRIAEMNAIRFFKSKSNPTVSFQNPIQIRQTDSFKIHIKGWFTLGLRKAEQSLKTGLFYYDEISTPCSARACASPAQRKNFYALEGTAQPSSARISAWAGTVLKYSVGIIQEGGVFMPPSWIIPTFAQHFREEEQ